MRACTNLDAGVHLDHNDLVVAADAKLNAQARQLAVQYAVPAGLLQGHVNWLKPQACLRLSALVCGLSAPRLETHRDGAISHVVDLIRAELLVRRQLHQHVVTVQEARDPGTASNGGG